jgi:hypothetical protein
MTVLPDGPAPDADLDRNASMYRAAVSRTRLPGAAPFGFMVLIIFVTVIVLVGVAVGFGLMNPIWKSPGSMLVAPKTTAALKAAPPAPAKPAPPTTPAIMPRGPDAFAK